MKRMLTAGCVLPLLLIQTAYAKDDTLELLAQKGLITAEEYIKLKDSRRDEGVVSLKDGFKVQSQDGKGSVQLSSLLQMDVAAFKDGKTDAASGTEMRRVRLSMAGVYQQDWEFKLETEFAGTVGFTDAYAAYNGFKPLTITAGHFKSPYSLEALMADKNLTFMERSLSSAFLNPRAPGLMVGGGGDNWSGALAVVGEQQTTATIDDEGGGLSGRVSYAPFFATGQVLHLGLSANWRKPTQSNAADKTSETLRLRSKPEANQYNFKTATDPVSWLVDTGNLTGNVKDYTLVGLELAGEMGPVVLQSEYSLAKVKRATKADLDFAGGYVQAAWAITGEARAYRGEKGIFDGIKPAKAGGAWEAALRYSLLDLNDQEVKGGKETNLTLGLNWYANSVVKVSANYVKVLSVKGGAQDGNEPSALQFRGQVAF